MLRAVRRYTEASDTRENISQSGSFPTSVLEIEPQTTVLLATASLSTALLRRTH